MTPPETLIRLTLQVNEHVFLDGTLWVTSLSPSINLPNDLRPLTEFRPSAFYLASNCHTDSKSPQSE